MPEDCTKTTDIINNEGIPPGQLAHILCDLKDVYNRMWIPISNDMFFYIVNEDVPIIVEYYRKTTSLPRRLINKALLKLKPYRPKKASW